MCHVCQRNVVVVDVTMGDVTVTMHSCSTCETRWWDLEGRVVDLHTVLELASEKG